jgi:hypothetical protein
MLENRKQEWKDKAQTGKAFTVQGETKNQYSEHVATIKQ